MNSASAGRNYGNQLPLERRLISEGSTSFPFTFRQLKPCWIEDTENMLDVSEHDAGLSHSTISLQTLTTVEEVEKFRPFWSRHQRELSVDLDRFLTLVHTSKDVICPHVIVAKRAGEPFAILAGVCVKKPIGWRLGYFHVLKSPRIFAHFPRGALIGDSSPATCESLISGLQASLLEKKLPLAQFKELDSLSPLHQHLESAAATLSGDPVRETQDHWKLQLPESFDAFYKARTKREKNNIRNDRNILNKAFGDRMDISCLQQAEDVVTALQIADSITAKTYHRRLGIGFSSTPTQREIWKLAADRGEFRFYVLNLDSQPVAYWGGQIYGDTYFPEYTGFDPSYRKYSPGKYLLMHIIDELCKSPSINTIDFGYGEATYKKQFSNIKGTDSNIYVFARSLQGQYLRLVRKLVTGLHRLAKGTLKRLQILDKIRSKWRGKKGST